MDKNTITGILLIGVIFVAFMFINQQEQDAVNQAKQEEQQIESTAETPSPELENNNPQQGFNDNQPVVQQANVPADTLVANQLSDYETQARKDKFGIFYPSLDGEKSYYLLENDKISVKISSLGARVVQVSLIEQEANGNYVYKTHEDFVAENNEPICLFEESSSSQELIFNIKDRYGDYVPVSTKKLFFDELTSTDSSVVLKLKSENEESILVKYSLSAGSYHLDYSIDYSQVEQEIDLGNTKINWSLKGLSTEKLASDERLTCSVMYRYDGETRDYLDERTDDEEKIDGKLDWVAFKYKFFSSILITNGGVYSGDVSQVQLEGDDHTILYNSSLDMPYPEYGRTELKFFLRYGYGSNYKFRMGNFQVGQ